MSNILINKDSWHTSQEYDIIKFFQKEIMTESDMRLLNLVFLEHPGQEDLNSFLREWDIEAAGGHKGLLLAYFMKMHPELEYSKYVEPRLNGLIKFFRFQNMRLISHFNKIHKELSKANIDMMLIKGGAMRHLRPKFPRVMGDIDVLVREEHFKQAHQIVKNMGYDISNEPYSIDLHLNGSEEGILDIHKYINMLTGSEKRINKNLFKRATKQKFFNCDVLVPAHEDLLFITLVNLMMNWRRKTSSHSVLFSVFDCHYLINSKTDFDWNIVKDNAKKTKTETQICLAMKYINSIVPNLLPEEIRKDFLIEKKYDDYCSLIAYQRYFLKKMQRRSHQLKIRNAFSSITALKKYILFKPNYLLLKNRFVKNSPFCVKLILKKVENRHENR